MCTDGHEVRVGDLLLRVEAVEQDHAGTTGDGDGLLLVDAGDRTAFAEHDLAGHDSRVERPRIAELAASAAASTSGSTSVPAVTDAPKNSHPSGDEAEPWNVRSCVLAPTLVNHGTDAGLPVVAGFGPLLPFEVATKTPASAANRNATSSGPTANEPDPIE